MARAQGVIAVPLLFPKKHGPDPPRPPRRIAAARGGAPHDGLSGIQNRPPGKPLTSLAKTWVFRFAEMTRSRGAGVPPALPSKKGGEADAVVIAPWARSVVTGRPVIRRRGGTRAQSEGDLAAALQGG